ncbi:hypothetical protein ACTXT7_009907, partial [Hymenolepis weldensis]
TIFIYMVMIRDVFQPSSWEKGVGHHGDLPPGERLEFSLPYVSQTYLMWVSPYENRTWDL